jgi:hypothetical protein
MMVSYLTLEKSHAHYLVSGWRFFASASIGLGLAIQKGSLTGQNCQGKEESCKSGPQSGRS